MPTGHSFALRGVLTPRSKLLALGAQGLGLFELMRHAPAPRLLPLLEETE